MSNDTLANKLHEYMKFRANEEKQGYDLTPEWFQDFLDMGVTAFFGIELDEEGEKLFEDTQNPKAFQKYHEQMGS